MLNKMCESCLCLGKDCKGTENQVWSGCICKKTTKDLEKLLKIEGMTDGEIESIVDAVKAGELTIECIESQMPEAVKKYRTAI